MGKYNEKLRDPRWQKKRLDIFNRDGFQCQLCQTKTKPLHVHHMYYVHADPWDYPEEALVTLCVDCHEQESAIHRDIRDFQKNLQAKGMKPETIATISAITRQRKENFGADEIDLIVMSFYDAGGDNG